jgi:hypothetical protein
VISIIDSFEGKLKLWKTQLMNGLLTHIPSVQIRSNGTYYKPVYYIVCIGKLLKEFERRSTESERLKCTASFITNPFQEKDIIESVKLIGSV